MLTSRTIRILIIDDDEDDFYIISDYIKAINGNKFQIDWTNDFAEGSKRIHERSHDIYFVDYRLGNHTGIDLLKVAIAKGCEEPIILLTGKGNKTIDIEAMQNGATDYLIKSELNSEKIERCIRYSLDRSASLKELKTRETKYRNLFEGSKDSVFIADEKLNFIEVNHAASILLNCPIDELLKHNLFDFITDQSEKSRVVELLKSGENIHDLEIRIQESEKNRDPRSCLISLVMQKTKDDGSIYHGIIHDITNMRKAELANLQAQKLAANERLVRMLAHEIRNPLNNISLSIENLQLDPGGETQPLLLDIIQRNSVRINQIITELLNLTKPLELVFEKHSLQEVLDESLSLSKDRINLQKINLIKKYPDVPVYISADKSKLTIAFTNILINAVEAMKSSTGELSVGINSSGQLHSVSIKDNGHGIPEEYIGKLFEPLFTLKKNGMGLGLATAFSIIQSHKGSVHVESTVNEGSNFTINLNGV
jgi:PAS domain S-box-containing protein